MKHELFAADAKLVEALCEVSHRVSCSEGGTLFIQGGVCNGLYTLETRQHYQESSSSSIARYQQQLRSTLAKVRSHRRVPRGQPRDALRHPSRRRLGTWEKTHILSQPKIVKADFQATTDVRCAPRRFV